MKKMRVIMMMLSMAAMASASYVSEVTGTAGLVNYWGFEETSGTNAVDSVGSDDAVHDATGVTLGSAGPRPSDGFNGMCSGNLSPTYAAGGTRSDSAADLINTGAGTSNITVSFWYQLDATGSDTTRQGLVGYQQMVGVRYNFLAARMESGYLKIYLKDSGGQQITYQIEDTAYATAAKDSLWHNLVASWDGSRLRVYLDGTNKVSTTNAAVEGIIGGYTWDTSQSLVFGEDINGSAYLDGKVDEVAVFDTVLSDATVSSLYSAAVLESDPVYVSDYAVGDGVTDDRANIQAAIDATPSGDTLLFPTGTTYRISGVLYTKSYLSIDVIGGPGQSAPVDNRPIIYTSNPYALFRYTGTQISIRNLKLSYNFYNTQTNACMVLASADSSYLTLENCVLRVLPIDTINPTNDYAKLPIGIYLNGPRIRDVYIRNNELYKFNYGILTDTLGFTYNEVLSYSNHLHNLYIQTNIISDVYGDAICVNSPIYNGHANRTETPGLSTHHLYINDNELDAPNSLRSNAGFGVSIAGAHNVDIRDNTIFDCKWQGVHVEDRTLEVLIQSNDISSVIGGAPTNVWLSGRDGILLLNTRDTDVIGNMILDVPLRGIDAAYNLAGDANIGVLIAGNYIDEAGFEATINNTRGNGIYVGGPAGVNLSTLVSNNIVINTTNALIQLGSTSVGVVCTNNYDGNDDLIIPE